MESGALNPVSLGAVRPPRGWLRFFRSFLSVAGPYWSGDEKWLARGLAALLMLLTVGQVLVQVALNIWTERLYDSLVNQAMDTFLVLIGVLVAIVVCNVAVMTAHLRIRRRLQVGWRKWLTRRISSNWMSAGRHYQVAYMPGEHSNPDGRIAEDARITVESALDLAHSLLYSALLLASFINILWILSGPPEISFEDVELYIPGHLVWAALIYAGAGGAIAIWLGRPLVRAVDRRQTAEANFRFGLVRARENSLAIALLHGEADERHQFSRLFRDVIEAWNRQTGALAHIFIFTSSWSVLLQVLPVLIAAPRFITGAITLGVLMQIAQAFQQAVSALSWPVDNLPSVAEWRASAERVLGLTEALDTLNRRTSPDSQSMISVTAGSEPILSLRDVSVADPNGNVVLANVTLAIAVGERVLISGDQNASIKLFKAIAGLWPWGSGLIEMPSEAPVLFMTGQPYVPIGALRHAISYPEAAPLADSALRPVLEKVGLEHLATQLDQTEKWEQVLPVDELQRLGVARLLVHRPKWVFMHEALDALGAEGERAMLRLIAEELPDAAVIAMANHGDHPEFFRRAFALVKRNGFAVIEERRLERPVEVSQSLPRV